MAFCRLLFFFFKINFFWKLLSGIPSECQTVWILIRPDIISKLFAMVISKTTLEGKELKTNEPIHKCLKSFFTGFQLDWNLLRTFCPSSSNFVRTFGKFLGHFFNTNFYHNKRKLPSALLKLKAGVVLLPFRMVSAVWLIAWLFISWGEWSLSIVVGGSGWGTVFCCFFGRCMTR